MAFQRGEDTDEGFVGALIRAREAECLRDLITFLSTLGKRHG